MKSNTLRAAVPVAAALSISLLLGACGAGNEESGGSSDLSGTLNGAGASSQQAAVQAWKAGFQGENPDVTVNYDPVGSGGGREQFIAGGTSFAGSDAYLDDEELAAAQARCNDSDVIEVPVYVSPIAIIFNIDGVEDLNLSASTLGAIFEGTITSWDDPAIAADNEGVPLPSAPIIPVHRSDDSGTTENFTAYLDEAAGGSWTSGEVESWPFEGESAQGTAGVVDRVKATPNSISYADASQAGDLASVSVGVGEEFVPYSPEAAAAILGASTQVEGRGETGLALQIDRATEASGVYPIVLVSYAIACQTYEDADEAELVKSYLSYVISDEGQQAAADGAGAAPVDGEFQEKAIAVLETISAS